MIITDTHTHLYASQFDDDRDEMMQRAIDKGVTRFFVPAIDASYTQAMLDLERNYPSYVHLMTGVHPTSVNESIAEELAHVERLLKQRDFVAIGEIGIDLYWDKTFLQAQQDAFKVQIEWAKARQLPIVIHCREAFNEIFEILEEVKDDNLRGIFHCFTGSKTQAEQAISYGMKLGIGGVVTFKNGGLDKFLAEIPLRHIVMETDAPYLAPVPFRGKRNESSYIVNVLDKLATIYTLAPEEVAKQTTQNSIDLFGI